MDVFTLLAIGLALLAICGLVLILVIGAALVFPVIIMLCLIAFLLSHGQNVGATTKNVVQDAVTSRTQTAVPQSHQAS